MGSREIIGDLLRRASLTAPDLLAADIAAALRDLGGHHLVLYVVDYEQISLQPVGIAIDLLVMNARGSASRAPWPGEPSSFSRSSLPGWTTLPPE